MAQNIRKQTRPGISIKMMQISIQNEKKRMEFVQKTLASQDKSPWKTILLDQMLLQQNKFEMQVKKTQQLSSSKEAIIKQEKSIKKQINIITNKNSNSKVMTIVGRRLNSFKVFKTTQQSQNEGVKRSNKQNSSFTFKRLNYLKVMDKEIKNRNPPPKPMILIDLAAGDVKVEDGKMKVRYTVIGDQSDPSIFKNINILNYTDENWHQMIAQPQPQLPEIVINKIEQKQSHNVSDQLIKQQQKIVPTLINPSNQIVNKLAPPPILSRDLEVNSTQNMKTFNIFTQQTHSNKTLIDIMQTSTTERQISSVKAQTNLSSNHNFNNWNNPFSNKAPINTSNLFPQINNHQPLTFANPPVQLNNLFGSDPNTNVVINIMVTKKQEPSLAGGLFGASAPQQRSTFHNNKKKPQQQRAFL